MSIYFSTRDEITRVNFNDVLYIKSDGNYAVLVFKSGRKTTLLSSLHTINQLLQTTYTDMFIFIGRSHILNMNYISNISSARKTITIADDNTKEAFTLKVSKDSIATIRHAMASRMGKAVSDFETKNGNMAASVVQDS